MFSHMSVPRTELQSKIQGKIEKACSQNTSRQSKATKSSSTDSSNNLNIESYDDFFDVQKNFESILPTIMLFLEQEPLFNTAMNLDVNFRRVRQQNFMKQGHDGATIQESIFKEDGNTFHNTPIHVLFYKKIQTTTDNSLELVPFEKVKISSMS